jgi:hypothetical protein
LLKQQREIANLPFAGNGTPHRRSTTTRQLSSKNTPLNPFNSVVPIALLSGVAPKVYVRLQPK